MRPLIQPWTVSPAAAGLETIHTMIRTATMMPMILDNNGLASRLGLAAAVLWRSDVPGKLPDQKLTNQSSGRAEPTPADSLMARHGPCSCAPTAQFSVADSC